MHPSPGRRLSIDAFRGATIVGMILVNNPGDWSTVYGPLLHAEWHGWTPTDLIFPFFLFIVGVSIVLALGHRLERGVDRRRIVAKVTRRSTVLFALGLFLSGYPFGLFGTRTFERLLETWRIPGVLQRIAICYLLAALLFLFCRRKTLVAVCAVLLVGYWLAMIRVPVPALDGSGWMAPDIDSKGDHLAGWIDRAVLGKHLWVSSKVYDPEGLLSTLPALATTLIGVFAGLLIRRRDRSPTMTHESNHAPTSVPNQEPTEGPTASVARLFVLGTALTTLGYVWSWVFPINKPLWTSSYAVFTAGLASIALATFVYVFDLADRRRLARPLVRYGQNAIVVFVGSGVLARTLGSLTVGDRSLQGWIHGGLLAPWLPPHVASLAYAVLWVLGWYAILVWMDRRDISIRI